MNAYDLDEAWRRYRQYGDMRARSDLVDHYAYLVKVTAGRMTVGLPASRERDDLVSAGLMGLLKAIDQYDMDRKVKFETYAIALIRGGILEMLREDDWVPRSIREHIKHLDRAYTELEAVLGRPPTEQEVARELKMNLEEFHHLLMDTGRTTLHSLEDVVVGGNGSGELPLADVLPDDRLQPATEAELHARQQALAVAIDRLPERERLAIALYYYEGLTFKEMGRVLTVSESRAYQLHTQAVVRLRGYLHRDNALFQ